MDVNLVALWRVITDASSNARMCCTNSCSSDIAFCFGTRFVIYSSSKRLVQFRFISFYFSSTCFGTHKEELRTHEAMTNWCIIPNEDATSTTNDFGYVHNNKFVVISPDIMIIQEFNDIDRVNRYATPSDVDLHEMLLHILSKTAIRLQIPTHIRLEITNLVSDIDMTV